MTLIVSDGNTVAADGLVLFGDHINGDDAEKIVRLKSGLIVGLTGSARMLKPLVRWYENGQSHEEFEKITSRTKNRFRFLVFTEDCVLSFEEDAVDPDESLYPFAMGCSWREGMAAMLGGASPKKAIEIVSSLSVMIGGEIVELTIQPVTPPEPKSPLYSFKLPFTQRTISLL